jgi:hypothetical protein
VPSDAQGEFTVQVSMETGPLAGKLTGQSKLTVAGK